ncbi:MAG: putative alpha/beta superfamily hydrolase [Gammaproteobacteria bacterium]|jgi:pimeloyl-ACP methyl ester carboxylesterase|nr:putative alpha/beta superfamily hydrolase [Gammaproteobacteria bacterium]
MPKIKVNDIELYYETKGQGEPVVFITGYSADHHVWDNILDDYAKSYQIIAIDNRGSGASECPNSPYTIEAMADDVIALCDALGLKTCHFIGLSMGCAITMTIAYKYPERCKSIVLSNGFRKVDIKFALFAQGRLELFKYKIPADIASKLTMGWAFSSDYLNQAGMVEYLLEGVRAAKHPMTEVGTRGQLAALIAFDSHVWINQIKVPTLVIGSDKDMIVDEAEMQEMARLIPDAQYYCFKGAGHIPHIEKPQEFNKLVQAFIAGN